MTRTDAGTLLNLIEESWPGTINRTKFRDPELPKEMLPEVIRRLMAMPLSLEQAKAVVVDMKLGGGRVCWGDIEKRLKAVCYASRVGAATVRQNDQLGDPLRRAMSEMGTELRAARKHCGDGYAARFMTMQSGNYWQRLRPAIIEVGQGHRLTELLTWALRQVWADCGSGGPCPLEYWFERLEGAAPRNTIAPRRTKCA